MEKYLDQCISSLVVESLPLLEILIVNDGSRDRTLTLAQNWSRKYPDSIKVIDKPNGNYGSCINVGRANATGKYIKVLDADDSFDSAHLDEYIDFLRHTDADLIISDYSIVDEAGNETQKVKFQEIGKDGEVLTFDACMPIIQTFEYEMHAVAYKRSIFERFSYHQTEGISYTDQEWMFKPMAFVKTVAQFRKGLYKYLVGRAGQTVDPNISRKMVNQTITVCSSMLRSYAEIYDGISVKKRDYLEHRLMKKIPSIYRIILLKSKGSDNYINLKAFDEELKEFAPNLYSQTAEEIIKFIPFRYVAYWRSKKENNGINNVPILLKLCQSIITRII